MSNTEPVQRRDFVLVSLYTVVLYAIVLFVGGPLTMHEGVLSQTTRAMLTNHDWLVPRYGDAPWVERPPLPQWISCAICGVIGHAEQEWNVRIGSALAGLITVLLSVWLAGRLFGRTVGILSGLMLATMYNFIRYSTLAEADIYLAPIVAGALCSFAYTEILRTPADNESVLFWGSRPWSVLLFFVLLGMTNLAKGMVFGTVMAAAPVGIYLLWNLLSPLQIADCRLQIARQGKQMQWISVLPSNLQSAICNLRWQLGRYCWLWGWLAFFAIAPPWPLLVMQRYPNAVDVWHFDLFGRLNSHYLEEPAWYYFVCLLWVPQPWSLLAFIGLGLTSRKVWQERSAADRFVWCWALAPLLVFSLSHGKHHHYMLHFLAPWAILAAQAAIWAWQQVAERWQQRWALPVLAALLGDVALVVVARKLAWPDWTIPLLLIALQAFVLGGAWFAMHRRPLVAVIGSFAIVFVMYGTLFSYKGAYLHRSREDTAFLYEVRRQVPLDQPLMINSADEALEGLRMQYYIGDTVYFLHNLSFVRDDRINSSDVYVVTRFNRKPELEKYGQVEPLLRCKQSRREQNEADRWTLFHVHLRDDLPRKKARPISPMQAMYREAGPVLD